LSSLIPVCESDTGYLRRIVEPVFVDAELGRTTGNRYQVGRVVVAIQISTRVIFSPPLERSIEAQRGAA
jgi:hypothetical protein